jgi:hypothetical protein
VPRAASKKHTLGVLVVEVGVMKKTLVLAVVTLVLLVCGCAAKATTTTTSITSVSATTASSTSTTATVTTVAIAGETFTAELAGKNVLPAVDTSATGTVSFTVDATGTRVHFVLEVSNITDAVAARLHVGRAGANGQGLLILFPGPTKAGTFTGVLAEGNFSASALIGSLAGKTVADLVALFESGRAYVNVGTVKNPKGEIRGQIAGTSTSTSTSAPSSTSTTTTSSAASTSPSSAAGSTTSTTSPSTSASSSSTIP